jgi:hypothetical protein
VVLSARELRNSVYERKARFERYARYWVRSAGAAGAATEDAAGTLEV